MQESPTGKSRRQFLKDVALSGLGLTFYGLTKDDLWAADVFSAGSTEASSGTAPTFSWLGEGAPAKPVGVSWGVPWSRGVMAKGTSLVVKTSEGKAIPSQSWPLAYWPDGSLKWSGLSIAADSDLAGPLTVTSGEAAKPDAPVTVNESGNTIKISTGPLACEISRSGAHIIDTISIGGVEIARNGQLVAMREDRAQLSSEGILRREKYTSKVSQVVVEQNGPIRAVVRVEGKHAGGQNREWLPFVVRLYFTAGLASVRVVHSFIFDGDATVDFICGLGLAFAVPFREERQNRHVRFAADGDGVWGEPVLMSPGYREVLVKGALQMNVDQLAGKRIPNLDALGAKEKAQFETIAVWDGFKLSQLAPDSFDMQKRTGTPSSWLQIFNGHQARGAVFLGDVSGGLAVGMKDFWEKYPTALEINGATTEAGELSVWFWSPDAPAMDLRHYDTVGHDGTISYEDHTDGFSTPTGVANTNELTLWAVAATPADADVAAMARISNEPPLLVGRPEYYHGTRTLGVWSLPDKSSPDGALLEKRLDELFAFYQGEVDRRHWYGFWDFGDVMRSYDDRRHTWMYDIGGHAWNNTELMPNLWLWFSFLRSGRADIFRFAEAMTRNTSEVDVYHLGPFVGLGSRHNVSHWGCGAKEARISESYLKRFYYYLTTDERTGDLMHETLVVDKTVDRIQPLRKEVTRGNTPLIRIGPDWLAFASNWMTEWERTENPKYRDYILTGMKCIGAMPQQFVKLQAYRYDSDTKQLFDIGEPNNKAGEFLDLFAGDQIAMDLMALIPCREFADAWNLLCTNWATDPSFKGYTRMRIVGYVAWLQHNQALRNEAAQMLHNSLVENGKDKLPIHPKLIEGPIVPEPVEEVSGVNTPGVSQWAINAITTEQFLADFDASKQKPS